MVNYDRKPRRILKSNGLESEIACFIDLDNKEGNIDWKTVDSFGKEWDKFNEFLLDEIALIGNEYFDIMQKHISKELVALDVGCGNGRWSKYLADKVKFIEAVDPSNSVFAANKLLSDNSNVRVTKASVESLPFADESFDFVFSLGVLHHIPDTEQAMKSSVKKLKKEGFFLVYLYYNLDNRGVFYKFIFFLSNIIRKIVSSMPSMIKMIFADFFAIAIYFPLISLASFFKFIFPKSNFYKKIPLSYYINKSYKVVRNDALDRFGTPLEQRYSKEQIRKMMTNCGLEDIKFSNRTPYWHAIGKKI